MAFDIYVVNAGCPFLERMATLERKSDRVALYSSRESGTSGLVPLVNALSRPGSPLSFSLLP
jgi:hypothetical protein